MISRVLVATIISVTQRLAEPGCAHLLHRTVTHANVALFHMLVLGPARDACAREVGTERRRLALGICGAG